MRSLEEELHIQYTRPPPCHLTCYPHEHALRPVCITWCVETCVLYATRVAYTRQHTCLYASRDAHVFYTTRAAVHRTCEYSNTSYVDIYIHTAIGLYVIHSHETYRCMYIYTYRTYIHIEHELCRSTAIGLYVILCHSMTFIPTPCVQLRVM